MASMEENPEPGITVTVQLHDQRYARYRVLAEMWHLPVAATGRHRLQAVVSQQAEMAASAAIVL